MNPVNDTAIGIKVEGASILNVEENIVQRAQERVLSSIERLLFNTSRANRCRPFGRKCFYEESPRASAFVASLVAEPFGITDWHIIEEATFAGMCLDAFSHAIDDAADIHEDGDELTHVGGLLLAKAAQTYA